MCIKVIVKCHHRATKRVIKPCSKCNNTLFILLWPFTQPWLIKSIFGQYVHLVSDYLYLTVIIKCCIVSLDIWSIIYVILLLLEAFCCIFSKDNVYFRHLYCNCYDLDQKFFLLCPMYNLKDNLTQNTMNRSIMAIKL